MPEQLYSAEDQLLCAASAFNRATDGRVRESVFFPANTQTSRSLKPSEQHGALDKDAQAHLAEGEDAVACRVVSQSVRSAGLFWFRHFGVSCTAVKKPGEWQRHHSMRA
jgi:hypothetical protein